MVGNRHDSHDDDGYPKLDEAESRFECGTDWGNVRSFRTPGTALLVTFGSAALFDIILPPHG